jgi:hypothetical protein
MRDTSSADYTHVSGASTVPSCVCSTALRLAAGCMHDIALLQAERSRLLLSSRQV